MLWTHDPSSCLHSRLRTTIPSVTWLIDVRTWPLAGCREGCVSSADSPVSSLCALWVIWGDIFPWCKAQEMAIFFFLQILKIEVKPPWPSDFFSFFCLTKPEHFKDSYNSGIWNVCPGESDLVRSLRKKEKKTHPNSRALQLPFCRMIPCGVWTHQIDPSYLQGLNLSFYLFSFSSVEYVKQTHCKLICDNSGGFCWWK